MLTKISKGYQVTIPASLRHKLNLDIGSVIDIEAKADRLILRPIKDDLEDLFSQAGNFTKHSLTIKDLETMEDELYE